MSEVELTVDEMLKVVCPRCGATPGQLCVTPSGGFAIETHFARLRKAAVEQLPKHGSGAEPTG